MHYEEEMRQAAHMYDDGLITAKEMLGRVFDIVARAWSESTYENETKATVKLAQAMTTMLLRN